PKGGFSRLPDLNLIQVSWPDVRAWESAVPTAEFSAMSVGSQTVVGDADSLRTAEVDARFFDVLGIKPLIGGFSPSDFSGPRNLPVTRALISYGVWQARFGGDPSVIGQVRADGTGQGMRVVGVLQPDFLFPEYIASAVPEILVPLIPGRSANDP